MAEIKQWVNLPKQDAYAKAAKLELADLGERWISVVLSKRVGVVFGKLSAEQTHPYSSTEQGRNPRFFEPRPVWRQGVLEGIEYAAESVALPAAGGHKYRVNAKYRLEEKTSDDTLVAWRMIFVKQYTMAGVDDRLASATAKTCADALRDHFIELTVDGGIRIVNCVKALVGASRGDTARALAPVPTDLAPVRDHLVRVLWVHYLPKETEAAGEQTLTLGAAAAAACVVDPKGRTVTLTLEKSVLVGLEDVDRPFVLEAKIILDSGFFAPNVVVEVERDHVKASGIGATDRRKVTLELKDPRYGALWDHLAGVKDKTYDAATLHYRFRAVEGFSGGLSYSGEGLVLVATRAHWRERTANAARILLHELGHFLGMVANGKKLAPEMAPHYYVEKGHVGPHCSNGAVHSVVNGKDHWVGAPACVMFGATSAEDAKDSTKLNPTPERFCNDCAPIVKKLDLSAEALKHVHAK